MLIKHGCCYFQSLHFSYMLQEDSVHNSRQCSSSPLHPSRSRDISSGRSFVKHHPSRRRELSVRTPFCVQKLRTVPSCIRPDVSTTRPDALQCSTSKRISFPHRYGKTTATVQTTWLFHPDAILDKASHAKDVQPSKCKSTLPGRSDFIMKITCSRSTTVRTLGQHRLNAALFRKEYQQIWKAGCTVVRLDAA
jgi:hypothetical protein